MKTMAIQVSKFNESVFCEIYSLPDSDSAKYLVLFSKKRKEKNTLLTKTFSKGVSYVLSSSSEAFSNIFRSCNFCHISLLHGLSSSLLDILILLTLALNCWSSMHDPVFIHVKFIRFTWKSNSEINHLTYSPT